MLPRSRVRRLLRRGGACLAIGIALAWLVAWACAALRPTDGWPNLFRTRADQWTDEYLLPQYRQRTPAGDVFVDIYANALGTKVSLAAVWARTMRDEDAWQFETYPHPEDVDAAHWAAFGGPRPFVLPAWVTPCPPDSREHNIITSAWGWPARCLRGTERVYLRYLPGGQPRGTRSELDGYWEMPGSPAANRVRRLPWRPVWPGLILDATLYAALAWGLWEVSAVVRRHSRRRAGRCIGCGYNLSGLLAGAPCPECGAGR